MRVYLRGWVGNASIDDPRGDCKPSETRQIQNFMILAELCRLQISATGLWLDAITQCSWLVFAVSVFLGIFLQNIKLEAGSGEAGFCRGRCSFCSCCPAEANVSMSAVRVCTAQPWATTIISSMLRVKVNICLRLLSCTESFYPSGITT